MYGSATTEQVTGRPIDETKTSSIQDGKTTEFQIITMFGAPVEKTELNHHVLYVYKYCVTKGKGTSIGYVTNVKSTQSCDELTITFDTLGVVEAHSYLKDPTMKRRR